MSSSPSLLAVLPTPERGSGVSRSSVHPSVVSPRRHEIHPRSGMDGYGRAERGGICATLWRADRRRRRRRRRTRGGGEEEEEATPLPVRYIVALSLKKKEEEERHSPCSFSSSGRRSRKQSIEFLKQSFLQGEEGGKKGQPLLFPSPPSLPVRTLQQFMGGRFFFLLRSFRLPLPPNFLLRFPFLVQTTTGGRGEGASSSSSRAEHGGKKEDPRSRNAIYFMLLLFPFFREQKKERERKRSRFLPPSSFALTRIE